MASENVLSADNQQERLQRLDPWYVSGFVDGEGSFHIAFLKDLHMRTYLKVIPEFRISQNVTSKNVLEQIQRFFNSGNIKANHNGRELDRTYVLVVRNREDLLKKIIPFFKRYSLKTGKAQDFLFFEQIVTLMADGHHRTCEGARRIVELAYEMNGHGRYRSVKKETLLKLVESSETICENHLIVDDKI